jgi:hypothetical protein
MYLHWKRIQISVATFLALTVLLGCGVGTIVRWYTHPYCRYRFFANGQISEQWWQRRNLWGAVETVPAKGYVRFYSNGAKSCKGCANNPDLNQYYAPTGLEISRREWWDYATRDRGDGTFADAYPNIDGRMVPLAKEFDERQ